MRETAAGGDAPVTRLLAAFNDVDTIKAGDWLCLVSEVDTLAVDLPHTYGVAWRAPHLMASVCAPMPWNLVVGWLYRAYWWLRVVRRRDVLARAYLDGEQAERLHAAQVRLRMIQDFDAKLRQAELEAELRGARKVVEMLRDFDGSSV